MKKLLLTGSKGYVGTNLMPFVDRCHEYNPKLPPDKDNPGDGISDKTLAVLKAWRRFYRVGVSERITDYPGTNY